MQQQLFSEPDPKPADEIVDPGELTRTYVSHSRAENTRRAYRADWQHFKEWCKAHKVACLPAQPGSVANYICELAGLYKTSTIARRLAAISAAHQLARHPSPTRASIVRLAMFGIRRDHGTAPERKAAIRAKEISEFMVTWKPVTLSDLRDRAILLICYAGAFRRSELAAANVEDIKASEEGISIRVPKSKTDPFGEGMSKDIHYSEHNGTCPVLALDAWLTTAQITQGPLFRQVDRHGNIGDEPISPHSVMRIIKRLAPEFGLDPADVGAHSLRAGMVTDLFAGGVQETVIKQLTGHHSSDTLDTYRREAKRMRFNYTKAAGL